MQWITPDWPAPANIKAFTTLRDGGYSKPPYNSLNLALHVEDEPNTVLANRRLLVEQLKLPSMPIWLNQIHSTITVDAGNIHHIPDADASFTTKPGIVCAVLTADCLPLLVCNKQGTLVSAIHAGWRGLAKGVIEAAISPLTAKPDDLLVWLGPAMGPQKFEVGADVIDLFIAHDAAAKAAFTQYTATTWLADIYQLAKQRLHKLGIRHIFGGTHCTYTEQDLFFSFRRDAKTGRMANMIWMENT